jgi:hypothetical protein
LLANERRARAGDPRDIPARPRQTADEPRSQRIRQGDDDDGDRRRGLLGRSGRGGPRRHDDLDREAHQLARQVGESLFLPLGIAELQDEIVSLHIAEVAQSLPESLKIFGVGTLTTEATDPMHFRRLLCLGGERRHAEAEGEQDDEPDGL